MHNEVCQTHSDSIVFGPLTLVNNGSKGTMRTICKYTHVEGQDGTICTALVWLSENAFNGN
eukprot:3425043-Amphidinium_carterae.3